MRQGAQEGLTSERSKTQIVNSFISLTAVQTYV